MHSPQQVEQEFPSEADDPFRWFADAMPCIVLMALADGNIDYLNSRWREMTRVDEPPGHDAWVRALHSEDQERFKNAWGACIEGQTSFALELRLWSQSRNEHRWQVLHVRPHMNRAGAIVRWVGTCEDIHERKAAEDLLRQSEARLRTLIEGSPVGVVILSPVGQPIYYNRKCIELRGQEVDLSAWSAVLHPDDKERVVASTMRAIQQGSPLSTIYRFIHRDGGIVWVSSRTVPIHSGAELIGFVRTLEDITELKRTEESLQKANDELRQHAGRLENEVRERTAHEREALAELDKLSYSIVHDMRAPLRAMYGFSQALLEEYAERLDDRGKDFLGRIAIAARRQDKLIQDVLVYHGYVRRDFRLEPVNLDEVVSGIVHTYPQFQPPKVHLEIRTPLGCVLAHDTLLMQCVSALLDNAAKFVAPGMTPEIIISSEKSGDCVTLSVQDNGIGIAPESEPKLFDIFYKFHRVEEYPGTGIGLPLARKALERMNGTIGVESQPGKGSRFWIKLPAAAPC